MSDSAIISFALLAAVTGIAYGLYLAMWVFKLDAGNPKMQEIAKAIQEGAGAYMNRQYKTVGIVAAALFVVLLGAGAVSDKFGLLTAVGFLVGAGASSLAGYVGMIGSKRISARRRSASSPSQSAISAGPSMKIPTEISARATPPRGVFKMPKVMCAYPSRACFQPAKR